MPHGLAPYHQKSSPGCAFSASNFIFLFLFFINLFICLFLAVLGLRCCVQAFSGYGERGLLFVAVSGLLIAVASLIAGTGSKRAGFSSCGSRALERRLSSCGAGAWLLRGVWNLLGLGLEPVSPALAGRFLITAPPGKPLCFKF